MGIRPVHEIFYETDGVSTQMFLGEEVRTLSGTGALLMELIQIHNLEWQNGMGGMGGEYSGLEEATIGALNALIAPSCHSQNRQFCSMEAAVDGVDFAKPAVTAIARITVTCPGKRYSEANRPSDKEVAQREANCQNCQSCALQRMFKLIAGLPSQISWATDRQETANKQKFQADLARNDLLPTLLSRATEQT